MTNYDKCKASMLNGVLRDVQWSLEKIDALCENLGSFRKALVSEIPAIEAKLENVKELRLSDIETRRFNAIYDIVSGSYDALNALRWLLTNVNKEGEEDDL